MGYVYYSQKVKEEVIRRLEDGETIAAVAKKFGISATTIFKWKKLRNMEDPQRIGAVKRKLPLADLKEFIIKFPHSSIDDICNYFKVSKYTVTTSLQEIGFWKEHSKSARWREREKISTEGESFTTDFKKRVIDHIQSGISVAEVSRTIHVPVSTLVKWIKEFNMKGKDEVKVCTREVIRNFISENPGMRLEEVAEALNLPFNRVVYHVYKLGYRQKGKGNALIRKEEIAK